VTPQVNGSGTCEKCSHGAFPLPFEGRTLVAQGSLTGRLQPDEHGEYGERPRHRRGFSLGKELPPPNTSALPATAMMAALFATPSS